MSDCKHYADLYGRCIDCGKTWEQRMAESREPRLRGDLQGKVPTSDLFPVHMSAGAREALAAAIERLHRATVVPSGRDKGKHSGATAATVTILLSELRAIHGALIEPSRSSEPDGR